MTLRLRLVVFVVPLLVAWSGSSTAEEPAPTPNLIDNPSFEDMDGEWPRHWRPSTWSGAPEFTVEQAFARSGQRCVRIASTEGADASWSFPARVQPNTDYRLTVWVKTEGLDAATGFGVQVNFHELQLEGRTDALAGTNDWTELRTDFNSGPHSSLLVNLLMGGWGRSTGTCWFDDVSLVDRTPAPPTLSAEEAVAFFERDVRPILEDNCFQCHGGGRRVRGGLNLTHRDTILEGGDSGAAVSLDAPLQSLLLRAVNYDVYEMPPSGKLEDADIQVLTDWVRMGLPWTPGEAPPEKAENDPDHHRDPSINDTTRAHWAFQAVRRPEVPPATGWARNEVDRFVLARLRASGLEPAPPAGRAELIRRATYDLTGLPPTPDEVAAFVADDAPDAYERLLERLLDSPHYGEKWARHWLDLVRYAESNSFERDGPKPHVWRYRDYVIDAFNHDKPYDRFLVEQLAGDELADESAETLIATGYYRLGQWDDEPVDPEQARFDELDDIAATTAQAMLGLTMNCARCHDHKLDPIPQRDYYRFLSFFENVRRYGVRSHDSVRERSVRVIAGADEQRTHQAVMEEYQRTCAEVDAQLEALEALVKGDFVPVEHEEFQNEGARVPLLGKRVGTLLTEAQFEEYQALTGRKRELRRHRPPGLDEALCVKERGAEPPESFVRIRGNAGVKGERVEPGFPEILSPPDPVIEVPADGESSGRRLALARWIASADNPLTARVMVNRLWQFHFGRGLVRSANNFGLTADAPTHPELLEWLAAEFVARDWSLKAMHRLLMTSASYRMSSRAREEALARDPANDLFWRFPPRRLAAEEVRDSILAVNGTLNLDRMYGPSIYPEIPKEVLAGQSRPGENWGHSPPEEQARRSIYIHVKRSLILPILANFDFADTDFTCPVRFETTQPTQALGMLNSDFLNEQAERFAEDLRDRAPQDPPAQVHLALARVFQREPHADEVRRGVELMEALVRDDGASPEQALQCFCLVALNLNEFLFVD